MYIFSSLYLSIDSEIDSQSDVSELNWEGLLINELTNGRAEKRVRAHSHVVTDTVRRCLL